MSLCEPIEDKDSLLHPYNKEYKGIRTGNSFSSKYLGKLPGYLYKRAVYNSNIDEKEAERLYESRTFEIDDGGLQANYFDKKKPKTSFVEYSLKKKYRWRLQEQIADANKSNWLNGESYSVSYVKNRTLYTDRCDGVSVVCDKHGKIKKSKGLSVLKDLDPEYSLTENTPVSLQYVIHEDINKKWLKQASRFYSLEKSVCPLGVKKLRKVVLPDSDDSFSLNEEEIHFEDTEEVKQKDHKITLNDFLQNKNSKEKKSKKRKSGKRKSWKPLYTEKQTNTSTDFDEIEEDLEENLNEQSMNDIKFIAVIPVESGKTFVKNCQQENISILDSKSTPHWLLLDFSPKIIKLIGENNGLFMEKLFTNIRFLMETKYKVEFDNIILEMNFHTNYLKRGLKGFQSFGSSFQDVIEEISTHIVKWISECSPSEIKEDIGPVNFKDTSHRQYSADLLKEFFERYESMSYKRIRSESLNIFCEENNSYEIKFQDSQVEFEDWQIECDICFEQLSLSNGLSLECGHWFCKNCWRNHLSVFKLENSTCPMNDCKVKVSLPIYLSCLNLKSFLWAEQRLIEKNIQENSWVYCRNPLCDRLLMVKKGFESLVMCPCSENWCNFCDSPSHWPATCYDYQQYQQMKDEYVIAKDSPNFYVSENLLALRVKKCPYCKISIEKNGGCPDMRCHCGKRFCWQCLSDCGNYGFCKYSKREKPSQPIFYFRNKCLSGNLMDSIVDYERKLKQFKGLYKKKRLYSMANRWICQNQENNVTLENFLDILSETFEVHKLACLLIKNGFTLMGFKEIKKNVIGIEEHVKKLRDTEIKINNMLEMCEKLIFKENWLEEVIILKDDLKNEMKLFINFKENI